MARDRTADVETVSTRLVYENKWMRVREDLIRRRDGTHGIYGVVEKADFAVIVPKEDDGSVHLVEQYRYPVQARYWELPQGAWELAPGIDPLELAQADLREETELTASRMSHVGHLFEAYGYCNQGYHVFLATGLARCEAQPDHEEQDLITHTFTLCEVERMICDGTIKDATTIAAFGFLRLKGLI